MTTVKEASTLLQALGLPPAQSNEMSALTLLTLAGLKPKREWKSANRQLLRVHDILGAMKSDWRKYYAENTRETIRRYVLHQFFEAGVVDRNPDDPSLPTNSPRTRYALTDDAMACVQTWGSRESSETIDRFKKMHGSLVLRSRKEHGDVAVPVQVPGAGSVTLSPGSHNEVQRSVIEKFIPRFLPCAKVVYLGDTESKQAYVNHEATTELGLNLDAHGKLPDIILWEEERGWLLLVEVVTSHGPVTPIREMALRRMFERKGRHLIFLTAFPSRNDFRKHLADIAWETEVWLADEPDHLIHFNGERFLDAYSTRH